MFATDYIGSDPFLRKTTMPVWRPDPRNIPQTPGMPRPVTDDSFAEHEAAQTSAVTASTSRAADEQSAREQALRAENDAGSRAQAERQRANGTDAASLAATADDSAGSKTMDYLAKTSVEPSAYYQRTALPRP